MRKRALQAWDESLIIFGWDSFCPTPCPTVAGMKRFNPFMQRTILRFGGAQLVQLKNGQHRLVGGSGEDRTTALEWVSLFAHEIILSRARHPNRTGH